MDKQVEKIIWFATLISVVALFFIADFIPDIAVQDRKIINWIFTFGIIAIGLAVLTVGNKFKSSNEKIGYILQLMLVDCIAVFGFVLKILGASSQEAGIYFLVSFIGLIFLKPKVGN